MPLSCMYDMDEFDYFVNPDDDFSIAKQDCKCNSCGKKIKAGETVLKFTCFTHDEYGGEVAMPDEFHCERCGEIYLNLQEIDYCLYSNEYMPGLLKDYQKMTGFNPKKYRS